MALFTHHRPPDAGSRRDDGIASRNQGTSAAERPVDLSELLAQSARSAAAAATKSRISLSFDDQGPPLCVWADPVKLQCCLHRLLLGALETLDSGFLMFSIESRPEATGRHADVLMTVAGTGQLAAADTVGQVLQRLEMTESRLSMGVGTWFRTRRQASSQCATTGARLAFSCSPRDGVLFKVDCRFNLVHPMPEAVPVEQHGERAWLVDADEIASSTLARRLQRLGWAVSRFDSAAMAQAALHQLDPANRRPALLVLDESTRPSAAQADALQAGLPRSTRLMHSVAVGSPALKDLQAFAGYELHARPFSAEDLAAFTREKVPSLQPPSYLTEPAPLSWQDRPMVLIVDDNEVNLVVASGLLESLGCEVITAANGAEALERCRQHCVVPRGVLMDIDMPVLNGVEATRQLRALQRCGLVPPFAIVGATAGGVMASEEDCLGAGMDGYLTKPLHVGRLKEELRRVGMLR